MPCGSTTDGSSHTFNALADSFPSPEWFWERPVAWLAGIALRWERRSQYRELLELDDRLFADIGVSREDVEQVRRSPLYLDAWRDSR